MWVAGGVFAGTVLAVGVVLTAVLGPHPAMQGTIVARTYTYIWCVIENGFMLCLCQVNRLVHDTLYIYTTLSCGANSPPSPPFFFSCAAPTRPSETSIIPPILWARCATSSSSSAPITPTPTTYFPCYRPPRTSHWSPRRGSSCASPWASSCSSVARIPDTSRPPTPPTSVYYTGSAIPRVQEQQH